MIKITENKKTEGRMKNIKTTTLAILNILILGLIISSCDQGTNPLSTENEGLSTPDVQKNKISNFSPFSLAFDFNLQQTEYPLSSSVTLEWIKKDKCYEGAWLYVGATKSSIFIPKGSITPPPDHPDKEPVTITYTIDKTADNELVYTFGPHGSIFNPGAKITMSFESLNFGEYIPKLFYILDNGTYEEQAPEQLNIYERWFTITIDHFSRYAVAYGR